MGLDTSHDCWHGPYSMFMRWRRWLAHQIGLPLDLMQGFYGYGCGGQNEKTMVMPGDAERVGRCLQSAAHYDWYIQQEAVWAIEPLHEHGGIPWSVLGGDPLVVLLHHSDCEGRIHWWRCKALALRLVQVYRHSADADVMGHGGMDVRRGCYDSMRRATLRFALGCLRAWRERRDVIFR